MKIIRYKVSLEFAGYTDSDLGDFGGNVVTSLTGNAVYSAPPVPPPDLNTRVTAFTVAIQAALLGGQQLTAAKDAAREALLDSLRKNAYYVQTIASESLDVLLTSGYYANSTNRASSPLDQPAIAELSNLATTKLLLRLTPITNARNYQVQTSVAGSAWQDAGIFSQARRIELGGMTPGTVYNVRGRAIGGSTGFSDWSIPGSLMAT